MHQIHGTSYGEYPLRGEVDREIVKGSEGKVSRTGGRISSLGLAASKKIKFHSPYLRLARRLEFERVFAEVMPNETSGVDNFALFDAVMKRG